MPYHPPNPNCAMCGAVKTTDNCCVSKINKNTGAVHLKSYCKPCASERVSIKKNEQGLYTYVIYIFRDTGGTPTYVGSTGNYHRRIIHHRSKGTMFPNEVAYIIETHECLTKEEGAAWAKLREDHYMDLYRDTIRNQRASSQTVQPLRVHGDADESE